MPLRCVPPRAGKSPFWYIRGTLYGRTVEASTKARDKKSAQRFKERFEIELAKADAEKRSPATFRLAAEQYKAYRKPGKQDDGWINKLVSVIGEYNLSDIRQHILIDAANELYPRTAPATRNRQALVIAASILHYAAENNLCPYIRVKKLKEKSPEPRALSKDQAMILIENANGPLRAILIWLFYQGWRISDILRVKWSDIDTKTATVKYRISKTDDWRKMPLHSQTVLPSRCSREKE